MSVPSPPPSLRDALHQVVGYLNFSSGVSDAKTLAAWNQLFAEASEGKPLAGPPAWLAMRQWLEDSIAELPAAQRPGHDDQATRMVRLIFSCALPAYVDRHRDLLFHQEPEALFTGFFLGRLAERLLRALADHPEAGRNDALDVVADDAARDAATAAQLGAGRAEQRLTDAAPLPEADQALVDDAFAHLDDYVGYRPLAMLEQSPGAPYPGEWVRPIPLYIAAAGVSEGPYHQIISRAIEALRQTDPAILRAASFDPQRMTELALDPRAYDFDHPVHHRANYIFGQWDPDHLDADGYYDRYVVREVTLEALLSRVREEACAETPAQQLLEEAASVLAGTILMGSGISGWGPSAHSSDVTLKSLMDPIATYRDEFYHDRIERLPQPHRQRLQAEMRLRRQPFGAARQHLNTRLAECRAEQLQHVQLARVYARMGYPDAAKKQADAVPVTSARIMCRIDCLLAGGLRRLRTGDLEAAAAVPEKVFSLLLRGIDCGACVDPWNILYFGGNFSLFPGPQHGMHDHRIDELVHLVEQHFGYMARLWSEAAARDNETIYGQVEQQFDRAAKWWRKYAAHTVQSVDAADAAESYASAMLVARALRLWHRGGASAGDLAFWAPHAKLFDSPRAYALVIGALLDRDDFVASMALLIHWMENASRVGLRLGGSSLPLLAVRWLVRLRMAAGVRSDDFAVIADEPPTPPQPSVVENPWGLAKKFLDFLEANAEGFWSAPVFALGPERGEPRDWDAELSTGESELGHDQDDNQQQGDQETADGSEQLYGAAYEEMTYRDTTDDGIEGSLLGEGESPAADDQDGLEAESRRLVEHLVFLESLSKLWAIAADIGFATAGDPEAMSPEQATGRLGVMGQWAARAAENRQGMLELIDAIRQYHVAPTGSDAESMRNYDRLRMVRDSLLERVIGTAVEISDSRRMVSGVLLAFQQRYGGQVGSEDPVDAMHPDDAAVVRIFASLISGDQTAARAEFPAVLTLLKRSNLLYIPLSRGGDPVKIFTARLRQRMLQHLLHRMPRQGLFVEACRLVEAARMMEQNHPIGMGAVTEFDGLFRIGFRSLVTSLVASVNSWPRRSRSNRTRDMIDLLESLTETMLASWLAHSQTLRLSSLETVADEQAWNNLVDFIRRYGDPIFTQAFLKLANIRAILHQGVGQWIATVLESDEEILQTPLFEAMISGDLPMRQAEQWLTLMFESILEHHAEFLDYNSTTTQSDRGDLIYMFQDFLRLRVRYERVAWNLKPVFWAHEILVRGRFEDAAAIWRRSLAERIGPKADVYVNRLRELQREYSMRMPTVADRILERFVQPMTIDRMRALVAPATQDAEANRPSGAFDLLEREADLLTQHPSGVGIDTPTWLVALEEEVETVAKRQGGNEVDVMLLVTMPIRPLDADELRGQLVAARRQGRHLPYMGS